MRRSISGKGHYAVSAHQVGVWLVRVVLAGVASGAMALGVAASASADGGTPVTCGSLITAPGEYYLASDCAGGGITIEASDVHLKLDGHTMTGNGGDGIFAIGSDVHIQGPGTITDYGRGMALRQLDNSHVEKVLLTANRGQGINVFNSTDDQFNDIIATSNAGIGLSESNSSDLDWVNNTASQNGSGFSLAGSSGNHLDGNTADNNIQYGIHLLVGSTANDLHGNTALGGINVDLADDNPNCDSNEWEGNHFVTTDQPQCVS